METHRKIAASQQSAAISRHFADRRAVGTAALPQRPKSSRNSKLSALKSEVVGRTINKLLHQQPKCIQRTKGIQHGIVSKFTDHLRNRVYQDNTMEKEAYRSRDFQRTLVNFERKEAQRKYNRSVKRQLREMKRTEFFINSPKMQLEKTLIDGIKRRERILKQKNIKNDNNDFKELTEENGDGFDKDHINEESLERNDEHNKSQPSKNDDEVNKDDQCQFNHNQDKLNSSVHEETKEKEIGK